MEQNTTDWESWRLNGIGASDAPIIMGESKYLKPKDLFEIKLGKKEYKPNEFITGLGHRFEPRARAYINIMEEANYQPALVEWESNRWLRASLDGYYEGEPLEIKFVGAIKLKEAKEGYVDLSHWIQMQQQMMVTGAMRAMYLCYTLDPEYRDLDEIHYHWVDFDHHYAINKMYPKLLDFWNSLQMEKGL